MSCNPPKHYYSKCLGKIGGMPGDGVLDLFHVWMDFVAEQTRLAVRDEEDGARQRFPAKTEEGGERERTNLCELFQRCKRKQTDATRSDALWGRKELCQVAAIPAHSIVFVKGWVKRSKKSSSHSS